LGIEGKDGEVVLRSLIVAVGEGFADSVIEQVLAAVVGREGYVVGMPERVERLALIEVRLSLSRHFGVLPGRHLVIVSPSCLSSQLLRRRTKIPTRFARQKGRVSRSHQDLRIIQSKT
jgi:hypothetical protein